MFVSTTPPRACATNARGDVGRGRARGGSDDDDGGDVVHRCARADAQDGGSRRLLDASGRSRSDGVVVGRRARGRDDGWER